jgi:hypothetical protein
MGLYKDADVVFQEAMMTAMNSQDKELADTVAWYRAHFEKLPAELMRAILTDEEFFQKALAVWGNKVPAPKPAIADCTKAVVATLVLLSLLLWVVAVATAPVRSTLPVKVLLPLIV